MKYVKMAEGVSGLFNKKAEVLLESAQGERLGNYKVEETLIPEVLNKPSVIEIENKLWRIIGVKEMREKSILRSRKICLRVVEVDKFIDNDRHLTPTLAYPIPEIFDKNDSSEHSLFLSHEEWRQFEFLPASMNVVIEKELSAVEKILSPEISPDPLLGYSQVHYRKAIGSKKLSIPVKSFCSLLNRNIHGVVLLQLQSIANSFVLRTDSNTYYGVCEDGMILDLCLYNYESVDDEFQLITSTFDLVMADWCNASYVYIDLNANEESPISDAGDNMNII